MKDGVEQNKVWLLNNSGIGKRLSRIFQFLQWYVSSFVFRLFEGTFFSLGKSLLPLHTYLIHLMTSIDNKRIQWGELIGCQTKGVGLAYTLVGTIIGDQAWLHPWQRVKILVQIVVVTCEYGPSANLQDTPTNMQWVEVVFIKSSLYHVLSLTVAQTSPDVHDDMKTDTDWVLANLNMSGYYRVNYDLENWHRLITQLDANHEVSRYAHSSTVGALSGEAYPLKSFPQSHLPSVCLTHGIQVIPAVSRARLIDDAFHLARWLSFTILPLQSHEYTNIV